MPEYINRETAIKRVMETKWESGSDGAAAMEIVAAAPAADVAPVRHGRWVAIKVPNEWDRGQCSECRSIFNSSVWGTNYCPNCGAKMDLEEEQHELRRDL